VEKEIEKPKATQKEQCIKQIQNFEEKTKKFLLEIKTKDFCKYETGVVQSLASIDKMKEEIKLNENILSDFSYNATMFGIQSSIENSQKNVENSKIEIDSFLSLWNHIKVA